MINLRFILWATTLITTSSVGAQLVVPAFADSTLNGAAPTNYTNSTNLLNNTNKANETINNNTTGYNLYRCPVQNGALCLDETTIIRCVDYVATYENCNAYLLNRPPVGVKTGAVCYQPNQAVYNAACGKNGLVYPDDSQPFTPEITTGASGYGAAPVQPARAATVANTNADDANAFIAPGVTGELGPVIPQGGSLPPLEPALKKRDFNDNSDDCCGTTTTEKVANEETVIVVPPAPKPHLVVTTFGAARGCHLRECKPKKTGDIVGQEEGAKEEKEEGEEKEGEEKEVESDSDSSDSDSDSDDEDEVEKPEAEAEVEEPEEPEAEVEEEVEEPEPEVEEEVEQAKVRRDVDDQDDMDNDTDNDTDNDMDNDTDDATDDATDDKVSDTVHENLANAAPALQPMSIFIGLGAAIVTAILLQL